MIKSDLSKPSGETSKQMSVTGWTITIVALSVAAWLATLVLMGGMDEGPGTSLHRFPVFLAGWILMLTAMMLPSELNYVSAFYGMLRARGAGSKERTARVSSFLSGYGIAWVIYGLGAFVLDAVVRAVKPEILAWDRYGPQFAGAVLVVAGLFQLTELKHVCLKGCRSPLSFFAQYWRSGNKGAVAMGIRHGIDCVGCCWAMMGVMFAVGAMSLTWMTLLTFFMFAEKVFPKGEKLSYPIAIFFVVMGVWIGVSPSTAPMLKNPMLYASICLTQG
jgi:predicted metal-binding membrane protein